MQQGHNGRHAAAAQASETQRHAYYGGVEGGHVYTHSSAVQQKAGMVFTQVVASCTDAGTSCTAPRAILDVDATNDAAGANVPGYEPSGPAYKPKLNEHVRRSAEAMLAEWRAKQGLQHASVTSAPLKLTSMEIVVNITVPQGKMLGVGIGNIGQGNFINGLRQGDPAAASVRFAPALHHDVARAPAVRDRAPAAAVIRQAVACPLISLLWRFWRWRCPRPRVHRASSVLAIT